MLDSKGFDLWADGYDASVQVSDEENTYPFAGYKRVLGAVYAAVRENGAKSVLDIGFGTGVLTRRFYQDGLDVYGVDFSQRMIELAQAHMPEAKLYQADFAEGLPDELSGGRYDAIVSTYALHHVTDGQKAAFLRTLFGLLTPGGVLVVGDLAFQTRADFDALCQAAGGALDEDEFYPVYDEFGASIGVPYRYEQYSVCAGVLTLRKPRLVIFDFGETLALLERVDYAAGYRALLEKAVENPLGITPEQAAEESAALFRSFQAVRDMGVEVHEHQQLRLLNARWQLAFDMPLEAQEWLLWAHAEQWKLTDGIADLLGALARQGIRTAVLSNIGYSSGALERRVAQMLPEHALEAVAASSDYAVRKPDGRLFKAVLAMAGVAAQDAWHCGDSFACDVQGAQAAGVAPVWYTPHDAALVGGKAVGHWEQLTAWMG